MLSIINFKSKEKFLISLGILFVITSVLIPPFVVTYLFKQSDAVVDTVIKIKKNGDIFSKFSGNLNESELIALQEQKMNYLATLINIIASPLPWKKNWDLNTLLFWCGIIMVILGLIFEKKKKNKHSF